VKDT